MITNITKNENKNYFFNIKSEIFIKALEEILKSESFKILKDKMFEIRTTILENDQIIEKNNDYKYFLQNYTDLLITEYVYGETRITKSCILESFKNNLKIKNFQENVNIFYFLKNNFSRF